MASRTADVAAPTPHAFRFLRFLFQEAGSDGVVQIGQGRIGDALGLNRRWIPDHARRLEAHGFIEILPTTVDARGTPPAAYRITDKGRALADTLPEETYTRTW